MEKGKRSKDIGKNSYQLQLQLRHYEDPFISHCQKGEGLRYILYSPL